MSLRPLPKTASEMLFSFFCFRFSFGVCLAFFCSSRLPLSLFPLSPIIFSPGFKSVFFRYPLSLLGVFELLIVQSLRHGSGKRNSFLMMLYFKEKQRKEKDYLNRKGNSKTVLFVQWVISCLFKGSRNRSRAWPQSVRPHEE